MKQCMGCMEIYQDNLTRCPVCGYEEGTMPENTLHMEPGSVLNNRYIIGKVLGYGGFGVTYIAWDTLLEQKVAIKEFLPSEYATRMLGRLEITIFSGDKQKQFMEGLVKFIAEAKKIAKFNNVPGIVKIYDCIEENNTAYIIMEYLEGVTLAEKLEKEKRMKPDKAIQLLLPVMEALKKVNLNGIIHRDIAPDNIFITNKGEPKLIDFGAARYATTSLSRSLTIIIKPGYSPEEQYRSMGDQGSWTDVYSIGATLYKMITGETPCDSMERKAYLEQYGTDLLKPISKFVNIDKNQENAIMNALNIKIHERTMNMGTLMEELISGIDVKRLQASKNKKSNILLEIPFKVKLITLISVILFVVSVSVISLFTGKEPLIEEGMTRVPNIRNIRIELAIKKLESCNLKYKITGYTYSTSIPANSVMTQSIKVGEKVRINTEIELTVSKVDNAYEMNNVLAMNYVTAKQLLEDSGYTVNMEETRYDDVIAKNCIVKQDLDKNAGEKIITIMVSKGRELEYPTEDTFVPKFVGIKFTDCFRMAKSAGVMLEVIERKASKEIEEGEVLTQNIEPNTTVKKGTVVKLIVSKGTDEITIDDFTNWEIEKARDYLTDQGIILNEEYEVNDSYAHGIVFGQSLESGSKVKTGETITLKVSIGPEEFEMVSLYKKTKEDAIQILKEYGLEYEVVSGYNTNVDDDCVYHQSISKGTKTKVGEKVIIKIKDVNADIQLPDMVGKKIEDIEKQLRDIGFSVQLQKEFNDSIENGTIITTSPEGGTTHKVGTTVTIVYSGGVGDIQSIEDVKNNNYTQAETTLKGQGLNVKFKYVFDASEAGKVIEQSIAAGQRASTGDQIELTVSKGPQPKVTFATDPLKMKENSTTQTYATIDSKVENVRWEIRNTAIANAYPTTNPSYETGEYISQYVVVSTYKKGTTNLVMIIEYIDGSTSEHKCKLIVE